MKVTWVISMRMSLSKWMDSMRFEWIEVNRMNRGEMSELMDLMRWTLWEWSYGRLKVSLWKWLEWKWKWKSLSKWMESIRNEWIEVNRVNRGEMKDLKEMTLWTLWEWSYGREKVNPMKVTWNEWFDQTLSKWMDSMRFEWIEVNRSEMSEMSDLNEVS